MPQLLVLIAAAGAGFILGKGVEGTSNLVKWGVIGGGAFIAAKHFKVL